MDRRGINRRKVLSGLAAAGLLAGGYGSLAGSAQAAPRTVTVQLLGGKIISLTVDVPPGTPLDKIHINIPGAKILSIDSGPTAPTPTPQPSPQPTPPGSDGSGQQQSPRGGEAPSASTGSGDQSSSSSNKTKQRTSDPQSAQRDAQARADQQQQSQQAAERKARKQALQRQGRRPDGTPTLDNPGLSLAVPGPAAIGVPNFMIDKYRIPPFLLPIYQAAGTQYGVRWEILAAINEIETDYGRNLNISSAGAMGWMQFMPGTWKQYGTDANKDGMKDPFNPVDAIFAAARYLKAAGAETDLRKAIFAYNHANWYVDSVVMRARLISGLPPTFVGSLTGLTQGSFPVAARARYADDIDEADATKRLRKGRSANHLIESKQNRRAIKIFAKPGSEVVAVNDGKIKRVGKSKRLGRFVMLEDPHGNTYTYGHLDKVPRTYLAPKRHEKVSRASVRKELDLPKAGPKPTKAASENTAPASKRKQQTSKVQHQRKATARKQARRKQTEQPTTNPVGQLFKAMPDPQSLLERLGATLKPLDSKPINDPLSPQAKGFTTFAPHAKNAYKIARKDTVRKRFKEGARVVRGTPLGSIGKTDRKLAPHVQFEIRPAGRGAPRIDPKVILDGWKLLENTALYRAQGRNALVSGSESATIGQILMAPKETLVRRVLSNPRIDIYGCGRRDVRAGIIDRRVLAAMEFLAASGLRPTVTSLRCGHSLLTSSGNISHHSTGNAMDIAAINGIPILGHQGRGSITELAIRRLLTLQGGMTPDEIISLMTFEGADHTIAMDDHADHIHVGFPELYSSSSKLRKQINAELKPGQWIKLIDRLSKIDNPTVRRRPSAESLRVKSHRGSQAHQGE